MARVYNFSAGPATLPLEVLQEAQAEFVDFKGTGMSLIEASHRGKAYDAVHEEAVANISKLAGLTDDYAVAFMTGGASQQFAQIPMNLLGENDTADHVNTGAWTKKAIAEAKLQRSIKVIADVSKESPLRMPREDEFKVNKDAVYLHLCSNETIAGTQLKKFPKVDVPIVADMSSDMFSRPFDIRQFGAIYAGAQKNMGPAGVTIVIMRKDLAARVSEKVPKIFRYTTHIENNSLYNTPPTFSIYIVMLVTRWIMKNGGLAGIEKMNAAKAAKIYDAIDASSFYRSPVANDSRSFMNITFRLPSEELEAQFVAEAKKLKMDGLKGHRDVGGIRASIYNAFPMEGIDALVQFMTDFEKKNG